MATMEETVQAARDCLVLGEKAFSRGLDLHTDLGALAALFLARAGQSLQSVLLLAPCGLAGDAMSVARTIVELEIDFQYIATNPGELIPKFREYDDIKTYQLVDEWERHTRGRVDADRRHELFALYSRAKFNQPDSGQNWAGIPLDQRADRVGRKMSYAVFYRDMCRASHSGYGTLSYAMPDREHVGFGPAAPDMRPLVLAAASYFVLIGSVGYACAMRELLPEHTAPAARIGKL